MTGADEETVIDRNGNVIYTARGGDRVAEAAAYLAAARRAGFEVRGSIIVATRREVWQRLHAGRSPAPATGPASP